MVHYFDPHLQHDPPPQYRDLHPGRLYDGEISFVDAEIGRLIERIDREVDDVDTVTGGDEPGGRRGHMQRLMTEFVGRDQEDVHNRQRIPTEQFCASGSVTCLRCNQAPSSNCRPRRSTRSTQEAVPRSTFSF